MKKNIAKQLGNINLDEEPWGYHLLVNAKGCNDSLAAINNSNIKSFLKYVLRKIKMKPFGKPLLKKFGGNTRIYGYTLIQMIQTSSITAHFVNHTGDAYIDVFSCKSYDPNEVINAVRLFFKPTEITSYLEPVQK